MVIAAAPVKFFPIIVVMVNLLSINYVLFKKDMSISPGAGPPTTSPCFWDIIGGKGL